MLSGPPDTAIAAKNPKQKKDTFFSLSVQLENKPKTDRRGSVREV
jgi:hypothetical protein